MLVESDVIAGHLRVADEEACRRKSRKSCADYVCILVVDPFGLLGRCKCLIVTAAVILFFYLLI